MKKQFIMYGILGAMLVSIAAILFFTRANGLLNLKVPSQPDDDTSGDSFTVTQPTIAENSDMPVFHATPTTTTIRTSSTRIDSTKQVNTTSPKTATINTTNPAPAQSGNTSTGSAITVEQIKFSVVNIKISKELAPYPTNHFMLWNEKIDGSGRLKDHNIYVFVTMEVENLLTTSQEYYLNSCQLRVIDKQNNTLSWSELRFCDQGTDANKDSDFFKKVLPSQKAQSFVFGYVFNENELKNHDFLVWIEDGSLHLHNERYIKIIMS
ncbi:MAG: hypothetical protein PHH84_06830 [Oscillospiraceae bacterium]|nr:hypothetical protein [Oscillospiraceae bacterium]MDD4414480.1 hypothetical protein [Oscillospiraceae bacterium]